MIESTAATTPPIGDGSGPRSRRGLAYLLRALLTVAVVIILIRVIDFGEVGVLLMESSLEWLPLILLLRPAIYALRGLRVWQLLGLGSRGELPVAKVLGWHFVSLNLGVFTPLGLGDFTLVHFLRRYGVDTRRSSVAVVADKTITITVIVILAVIGAVLFLDTGAQQWAGLAAGVVLVAFAGWMLYRSLAWRRPSREGWANRLRRELTVFIELARRRPGVCLLNVLGAVLQSILFAVQLWLVLRMIGIQTGFMALFWISSIGRWVNLLPVTINGLGLYEGAMVVLMERIGVSPEAALAATLVPRAITWVLAALTCGVVVWWRRRPVSELS